eukprot:scaffold200529_cov31-Tisochrysis_lutea.AAC.2
MGAAHRRRRRSASLRNRNACTGRMIPHASHHPATDSRRKVATDQARSTDVACQPRRFLPFNVRVSRLLANHRGVFLKERICRAVFRLIAGVFRTTFSCSAL